MAPISFRWDNAEVLPEQGAFALRVDFSRQLQPRWWDAFASGIEIVSKETNGARWSTIAKVGEPPTGMRITGIDEESAPALREFLESAAATANEQIAREEEKRSTQMKQLNEQRRESAATAARLKEAFRAETQTR
jgi:hypothetical protein